MGERSSTDRKPLMLSDLSQGLFDDRSIMDIPPGGASACSNVVWINGYLKQRPGLLANFGTLPYTGAVVHLTSGYNALGRQVLYALQGLAGGLAGLSVFNPSTTTWTGIINTLPYVTGNKVSSCFFKYQLYFSLGGEPFYYNGTTVSTLTSLQVDPVKKPMIDNQICAASDSTLFLINGQDRTSGTPYPARVTWSDFIDATTWGGQLGSGLSGLVDLPGGGDSSPLTGIYTDN